MNQRSDAPSATGHRTKEIIRWLEDFYDETDGKWQSGIAGNCNLVHYNGEDIVGIGFVQSVSRREFIADLRNLVPEILTALYAASERAAHTLSTDSVVEQKQPLARAEDAGSSPAAVHPLVSGDLATQRAIADTYAASATRGPK